MNPLYEAYAPAVELFRAESEWRNPVSAIVYPQGVAMAMVREGADPDVPSGPEGGA